MKNTKKINLNVDNPEVKKDFIIGNVNFSKLKKINIPRTSQETIPFQELYENGLIKVEQNYFAIVCEFSNINYILLREEEQRSIFDKYQDVLNSLDTDIHYQEIIVNEPIEYSKYENSLLPKKQKFSDEFDADYVKVQKHFIEETYSTTTSKHNYLALGYSVKSNLSSAYDVLTRTYLKLEPLFKSLGATLRVINDPVDIMQLFYTYFNPFRTKEDDFLLPRDIYAHGMNIKDYIAPSSFEFERKHIEMGSAFARVFFVKSFAAELKDDFLKEILDNTFNVTVSKHLHMINKDDALTGINNYRNDIEQVIYNRRKTGAKEGITNVYIPAAIRDSLEEATYKYEKLQSDQNLFQTSFFISISANSLEELDNISKSIKSTCRKHLVYIDEVTHRQEKAMSNILPLAIDRVNVSRSLLTEQAAILFPFAAQNVFDQGGFYYGRNQLTSQMIVANRKMLKNGNGMILGKPGAGKSFKAKREIIDVSELTDDNVIIIDPEREFAALSKKLNGEDIVISLDSETYLNPFEISADYSDGEANGNPVAVKSDFITSITEAIMGNVGPEKKSLIDQCVREIYVPLYTHNWDAAYMPTFVTFYDAMLSKDEPEAKKIALALEPYVNGSFNLFAHKSNVTLKNRITRIDIKNLPKQLKKVGLLIVLDYVWNLLCKNKDDKKFTWLYTDEFYILFDTNDGKDTTSSDFYYMIYKRARKYGGLVTGITQNVEDLLQSQKARSMLGNSEFIILLDQAPLDHGVIKKIWSLSDLQGGYIISADSGSGLIIYGNTVIPFKDQYPKDNAIYKAITTKLQEA